MKRRLASVLLIAALALFLAVPASASETSSAPADIAAAFMALLDRDGIEYTDLGRNSYREYGIEIRIPGNSQEEHVIELFIDSDGKGFSACEQDFFRYDEGRRSEALGILNSLNDRYLFVEFTADTSAHTVCARQDGVLLGSADRAAVLLRSYCDRLPGIVEEVREELTEKLSAPAGPEEPTRAGSAFPGTWRFSAILIEAEEVEGGLTLTADDMGSDEFFLLRLYEDGTAELVSPYEEGTASCTWDLEGDGAVLFVYGERISLLLEDGDTLLADVSEAAGFTLRMVRRTD